MKIDLTKEQIDFLYGRTDMYVIQEDIAIQDKKIFARFDPSLNEVIKRREEKLDMCRDIMNRLKGAEE